MAALVKSFLILDTILFLNIGFSQNISQVYGGGGSSGAVYQNDFVELFNPSASAINLNGWSVQYNSSTGTGTWSVKTLPNVTMQPYHYFLVQLASGTGSGISLPAPDATGTINISATSGKIALCNSTTAMMVSNPIGSGNVVDFVGYGTSPVYEGSGPATGAGNNTSLLRKGGGFVNTFDNANDFTTISAPEPRNSGSANPPPPPVAPVLTLPARVAGQFTFRLTGTSGSNYVVQESTNLSGTNWISLRTNAAPFSYTQSATVFPRQFYRARVAQ